jgi:hypothetical protein
MTAMSALASIKRTGATPRPPRLLIYGPHKIGKSTFAAQAPNPIFIQIEDGLDALDTSAFPQALDWETVVAQIGSLATEQHEFNTLVVDSLDWLERLIWAHVCTQAGHKSIEDFGYGKGYIAAVDVWKLFLEMINHLRDKRGMAVIMLAHAEIKRFDAPDKAASYDRYQPKLHAKAGALVSEAVDVIGFANYQVSIVKEEQGFNKERAVGKGTGMRRLFFEERPSHIAGNRYRLPAEIEFSWSAFADAFNKALLPQSTAAA